MNDTRPDRCAACPDHVMLGDAVACPYIVTERQVCGDTLGLPSLCRLHAMQLDPAAHCPHPAGNRWEGAAVVMLSVLPRPWLDERAGSCMTCEDHLGVYRCASNGGEPVNHLVRDRTKRCPKNPPRWLEAV